MHDPAVSDKRFLRQSNVTGTRNLVEASAWVGTESFVFTSSNCLWARKVHRPVCEGDTPARPVDAVTRIAVRERQWGFVARQCLVYGGLGVGVPALLKWSYH